MVPSLTWRNPFRSLASLPLVLLDGLASRGTTVADVAERLTSRQLPVTR